MPKFEKYYNKEKRINWWKGWKYYKELVSLQQKYKQKLDIFLKKAKLIENEWRKWPNIGKIRRM